MSYRIGALTFNIKQLSLREDKELALIIADVFSLQQEQADDDHKNKLQRKQSDIPFIETHFVNDSVVITGGFLSKLLETGSAEKIAELFLELVPNPSVSRLTSFFFRFKKYRLNYLSKHIKGDLKAKLFTDFFSEGTVYASSLVNHFLMLLSSRIAQLEELNSKESA